MKKALLSQLRELREQSEAINPSQEWVASNREQLVSQISNTVADHADRGFSNKIQQLVHIFMPAKQLHALRGVFVFLLVFGLATSGVVASASPLPRDIVFNVKVAAAAVTGNSEAKGKLHLEEAKHQTEELQRKLAVADENTPENTQKDVEKQLKKIKKQVDSAKKTLEKAKETKLHATTATLAKELTIETTAISASLKEVTAKVSADAMASTEQKEAADVIAKEVVEVRKNVVDAGIDALGVLVEPTAKEGLPEEEAVAIHSVVEEKIGDLLSDAEEVKKAVEATKQKIEEDTIYDMMQDMQSTTSIAFPSSSVSTSTVGINQDIQALQEKSEKTTVVAEQVKVLLQEQQVDRAVEYLKELSDSTLETEKAVIETQQKLEQQDGGSKEDPQSSMQVLSSASVTKATDTTKIESTGIPTNRNETSSGTSL